MARLSSASRRGTAAALCKSNAAFSSSAYALCSASISASVGFSPAARRDGSGSPITIDTPCGGTSGTGRKHQPQKKVTLAPNLRDSRAIVESPVAAWWKKSLPPKTYIGISRAPVSSASRHSPRRGFQTAVCVPGFAVKISASPPGSI